MSNNLIYTTKCRYCEFTVHEHGFSLADPREIAAGNVQNPVAQFVGLKLLGHLQRGAQHEQAALEQAHKLFKKAKGPEPNADQCPHLQAMMKLMELQAQGQGIAILQAFTTQDPVLNDMHEQARYNLHQATRKIYLTDDMLLEGAQALNLDLPDQNNVLKLLQGIRDALQEQGQHGPKIAQPPASVIVS